MDEDRGGRRGGGGGLSTAEIVSQSAGRDGSKIENGKRSNLFPFELPTRRAAGAELVFTS